MGFLDKAKGLLGKAEKLAGEHSDQVKGAIDKVEGVANKATKGTYRGQISGAGDQAADYVDGIGRKGKPAP